MLTLKSNRVQRRLALPFLLLALPCAAVAQSPSGAAAPAQATEAAASHSATANVSQFRAVRVSRLIGMKVRSPGPDGKDIATVRDLIVNADNARVRYAVLEFDPAVVKGERLVPVPVREIRMGPERQALIYGPDAKRVDRAAIDKSDWNDTWLLDAKRVASRDRAWGLDRRLPPAPRVRRGSTLIGQSVKSTGGESIGKVQDVVVHVNQQKLNYAIVRFDAQWAGKDKRLAVPMSAFKRRDPGSSELVAELDRKKVQGTPGITHELDQNPNERAFMADINQHLATFGAGAQSQR